MKRHNLKRRESEWRRKEIIRLQEQQVRLTKKNNRKRFVSANLKAICDAMVDEERQV